MSWAGLGRAGVGAAAVVAAAMLLLLCLSWAGLQNLSASCFLSTCYVRRFSLNALPVPPLGPVQARGGPIGTLDFLNFTDLYLVLGVLEPLWGACGRSWVLFEPSWNVFGRS